MELRPGYTMTELGVLPEDWEVRPLFSIARIVGGGTPSTAISAYWDGNISWFTPSEINDEKKYVSTSNKKISDDGLKKSSAKLLPVGTILLTTRASIGLKSILLLPATTNQGFQNLIINDDIDNEFIYYLLTIFKKELLKQASGSTFLEISPRKLGEILLCLPKSLPEQHAIAAALSDVDALLDAQERLIAKKRNIKLAAMQQLLTGKTRLPGFQQNEKYKQTELGILPEDWEVKMLGEGLSSKPAYGINAPACSYQKNFSAYIRITDITDDGKYIPAAYVQVKSNDFYLQDGDIVLARTGASVGKSYLYKSSDGQLVFAGFLIRIHPDGETFFPSYIFYYLHTSNYWKWVASTSMRSGQPGVNGQEYARLLLPCPPLPEQRAIAAVLSDMDAELAALEARRDKLRAVKQGMMRELLTGRTRLAGAGGRHGQ